MMTSVRKRWPAPRCDGGRKPWACGECGSFGGAPTARPFVGALWMPGLFEGTTARRDPAISLGLHGGAPHQLTRRSLAGPELRS